MSKIEKRLLEKGLTAVVWLHENGECESNSPT